MMNAPPDRYAVTKTYGHNLGFSATFRQWRATSHCRFLHGYSLQFELEFRSPCLNDNNWVIDFGSLKPVKKWLEDTFDHKTLVAIDDPLLRLFRGLADSEDDTLFLPGQKALLDLVEVPRVGCEGFAEYVANTVNMILFNSPSTELQGGADNGVYLYRVEAREHGANSATFFPTFRPKRLLNKGCEPETGTDVRTVYQENDNADGRNRVTRYWDSDGDDGA